MSTPGQGRPRVARRRAAPANDAADLPSRSDLRDVNEQLLLTGLRERELADRLRQLATERAAILDQVTDGIILTDPEGRITYVNEAARRLHGMVALGVPVEGYAAAYHLLTLDGQPFPPGDLPLARAVQRGETVAGARWRIRRPDGTEVVAEGSATPVLAEDGALVSAVLICRDVTAQVTLDQQREDFFAAVAHDLRTPLTAIKGNAQLLQRQARRSVPLDPTRLAAELQELVDVAGQMDRLLQELLELAQLRMGRTIDLHRDRTDLAALARRAVAAQQQRSERRHIDLEAATDALVGWWDAGRLERVLSNLLGNAVKYSPRGGEITVRLAREGDGAGGWAVLTVRDRGMGIPAADLAHVFDRFRRGSNVAGRIAGTGIGLVSARRIVEQHGGTIALESQEGEGTLATVRLPLFGGGDGAVGQHGPGD